MIANAKAFAICQGVDLSHYNSIETSFEKAGQYGGNFYYVFFSTKNPRSTGDFVAVVTDLKSGQKRMDYGR